VWLALLLTGCAADWRDRSVLSPSDQAELETLNALCMADVLYPAHGPGLRNERATACADITHRMLCHARVGSCP
jgi:hypothetical protein